ncbi:MAG TPA: aminopeptidase N, partial [Bdellovibrionales bacterium]|nr:aminopeptidase N [Bdellovibrionales bacterium]
MLGRCALLVALLCPVLATAASKRADEDNLTRAFAESRHSQVKTVDYKIHLTLNKDADEYKGKTTITTTLAKTNSPLSIDFVTKKIESIRVNGETITDYATRKGSFDIPAKYLKPNTEIEVEYTSEYSKTGDGFQKSKDPEDGSEYAYSDFEPFGAHTLFPCFDQPDLKATFRVSFDAPSEWKVISNELVESADKAKGRTLTVMKQTKPISTYLFFVGSGPFAEWNDKEGDIPLVIYARKSLAKYVDHKRLFDTTKTGLRFFTEYFGTPYPFSKYGQVFVPEFMWGGMENPGAVTLNEKNIYRGAVTSARLSGRDDLILHEMAHMWFGDLVTMKWWNDLWLNESFATYAATIAQARALKNEAAWIGFHSEKGWGYWQDQLITTHPIENNVADVRATKSNFDGITYAKGAATLKQLHFFVGEEGFREGLRKYFSDFAWKNTIREDFTSAIGKASKTNLAKWTHDWLQTAGPNRVFVDWSCKDGTVNQATMRQSPSVSNTLSPHRAVVGSFKIGENGSFNLTDRAEVRYDGRSTKIKELIGKPCPDFVYPNVDDQDYALFSLDETSVKHAAKALEGGVADPLLRLMIWGTLHQMVRDTKLSAMDYFNATIPALEKEKNGFVLGALIGRYSTFRDNYTLYLTPEQRTSLAPRLEAAVWSRATNTKDGIDSQLSFFDFYLSIAQTPEGITRLKAFLKNDD